MAERLGCSKGHRWAPVFVSDPWPLDFLSICPVCGKAPISPHDATDARVRVSAIFAVIFAVTGLAILLLFESTLPFFENSIPFGVAFLFGDVAIIAAGSGLWVTRWRTKEMASVAEAMNFSFMARFLMAWLRAIAPFKLFVVGWDQKAYNALFGRVGGCDVIFFEYQHITGARNPRRHRFTVVILPNGAPGKPNFQLTPRSFFTTKGIELEDAGEFNRRCKLVGRDIVALRKTFHPDLVKYLGRDGRWHIEVLNGQLLLCRKTRLKPDKCPGMVTDALAVRDLLRGPQKSNR